jgi:hypothetical protein
VYGQSLLPAPHGPVKLKTTSVSKAAPWQVVRETRGLPRRLRLAMSTICALVLYTRGSPRRWCSSRHSLWWPIEPGDCCGALRLAMSTMVGVCLAKGSGRVVVC